LFGNLAQDLGLALAGPVALFERLVGLPDPWQIEVLEGEYKKLLLNITRQGGKTSCSAILGLSSLLFEPGSTTVILSPSQRQSGEVLRRIVGFYHRLPGVAPLKAESATRLEAQSGASVLSLPATEGTIRGVPSVTLLILDEAARIARELIAAVRPMQAVAKGARCIAMSTPNGMEGFFPDAWHQNRFWKRIKVTADQVGRISKEFLAEQFAELGPQAYEQEFFGSFMSHASGQMFSSQLIASALDDPTVTPLFAPIGNLL